MKKKALLLAGLLVIAMIPATLGLSARFLYPAFNIKLVEKNVTGDWRELDGASARVMLSQGNKAQAILHNMPPNTDYTLIYYGSTRPQFNNIWPFATCITQATTGRLGSVRMPQTTFNYAAFLNDGIDQKFWIVPTSDVDCGRNRMIAWNPQDILFETATI